MNAIIFRRRLIDAIAHLSAVAATLFGLTWLAWILWTTVKMGAGALTPALVTQMTPPPGENGGLLNAFAGSAAMILLAVVIGTPLGVAGALYVAEHGRYCRAFVHPSGGSVQSNRQTQWPTHFPVSSSCSASRSERPRAMIAEPYQRDESHQPLVSRSNAISSRRS